MGDHAVFVQHDDRAGEDALQDATREGDAEGLTEVRAERRRGLHVGETFGAAEATLGERQVGRHAPHLGVGE